MADPLFNSPVSNPFGLVDVGNFAAPSFVDIDGDGDLDLFVGTIFGDTLFFRNTGSAIAPSFVSEAGNFGITQAGFSAAPTFADIDGDGDLDAFVGEFSGNTQFFRNTGSIDAPSFVSETGNFGIIDVGSFAKPTFADIDGDGDLDAFVGERYGNTQFFRNTGTATAPSFVSEAGNFGLKDVGSFAKPAFADIDGDGDLDAFVGGRYGNTQFFRNTGTATAPKFASEPGNFGISDVGFSASPTFADVDGDGDLDVLVGNSIGNMLFFENTIKNRPILTAPADITYTDTKFDDTFTAVNGVLSATDADGDILSFGITGGTALGDGTVSFTNIFGTLSVTQATGAYTFIANDGAIEVLIADADVVFTVTVSDGLLTDSKALNVNFVQSGITESNGNDTLVGTAGNDSFNGLAGKDIINGLKGADIMRGGSGNDTYVVDNVGDKVIETSTLVTEIDRVLSSISHSLKANVENLTLIGTSAINGAGNTLNNIIIGNSANNILNGLAGNDTLTGGLGNDTFRLTTLSRDSITDFSVADDTIQLENGVFTQLTTIGVLSANNFKIGAAADADDYILYNNTNGIVTYDTNGNGVGGATQIAVLGIGLTLANADFVVI